jgi:transposase
MKKPSLPAREFIGKRKWKLWLSGEYSMVCITTPVFWDDPSLSDEDHAQIRWYCGVEVHSKVLVIALYGVGRNRNVFGPIERFDNTPQGRIELVEFVKSFTPGRFLMETTGIYHIPVVWHLQVAYPEAQVMVMDAFLISKLLNRTRKSDPIDASRIAQIARYDELVKPCFVPDPHLAAVRDYTRQRIKAVTQVTRLKNRIKKVLSMFNCGWDMDFQLKWHCDLLWAFCEANSSLEEFCTTSMNLGLIEFINKDSSIQPWRTFNPSVEVRKLLKFLLQRLALAQSDQSAVEQQIRSQFMDDPELTRSAKLIYEAPGIGEFGALEMIAEIGSLTRFRTAGSLLVYAGIAPEGGTSGVKVTGATEEKVVEPDHPNPRCNRRLKLILVQGAKVIARMALKSKSTDDIVQYARQIVKQKLKYHKKLFKIAAKLGRRLYHCLQSGEMYQSKLYVASTEVKAIHVTRRRKLTKKKAILQGRIQEIWKNADQLFDRLSLMGVPPEQVRNLSVLFYTGRDFDQSEEKEADECP